jgi:hypothetical protein
MRKILLVFFLMLSAACARAQAGKSISLAIDANFNIPFNTGLHYYGESRDYYQDGIGGALKIEVPIIPELHFTGSAGFLYYKSYEHFYLDMTANYPGYTPPTYPKPVPYTFVPVKAGLRYYYVKYAYIDADAGEAFKANSVSSNAFIYSGGLGFIIPFKHRNGLDIGVRYESGYEIQALPNAMSQIGISVGYKFGW